MCILKKSVLFGHFIEIKLGFSQKLSFLYISNILGSISIIKLPSFYFWYNLSQMLGFIFLSKTLFKSFITNIKHSLSSRLYYIKIRIRGLGYRYRSICTNVHYFFFNYTNYIYFFNPINLFIKIYKKRMLLLSLNWSLLKIILSYILKLRKIGPYNLDGIRLLRSMLVLKKSGKKS